MQIAHIRISNILGIEELELDTGAFNLVEGMNGTGKTSVLEAIKAVVKGGEDATLLRAGATKGEVVLVLDDGTSVRRRITDKGSATLVDKDGVRSAQPQSVIKALTDSLSVNPVDFLRFGDTPSGKKHRLSVLLEALPIAVDPERLAQIAGAAAKVADPEAPALDQLAAVGKAIFDDRTGTNRAHKEKEATINQLSATLPTGESTQPLETLSALELRLEAIDHGYNAEKERISTKLTGLAADSQAKINGWREQISTLQLEITNETVAFAEIERRAGAQREISAGRYQEERGPIAAQVASIRQNRDAESRADATRSTIATMRTEADSLKEDSDRMTSALNGLDLYKSELLASLPIPGLAVENGEILRNGVVFDRLNSAQQVEIAVEIAKLRAGKLGVICVDGIEQLDSEHFDIFRDRAIESGLQLFVTRVSDGEFAISTKS